jgi:hypothetical protein
MKFKAYIYIPELLYNVSLFNNAFEPFRLLTEIQIHWNLHVVNLGKHNSKTTTIATLKISACMRNF